MKKNSWWRILALALAAGAIAGPAAAETSHPEPASAPQRPSRHDTTTATVRHRPRADNQAYRRSGADHDNHRKSNLRFREMAQEEIEQLPALHARLTALADIQARRAALQKQRKAAADAGNDPRSKAIGRFHTLLQKDLELAERARQIAQDIVKDTPGIKQQLQLRRQQLENPPAADAGTSAPVAADPASNKRESRMRLRYLDFLERKLDDIAAHPERVDLLVRMMKGTPRDMDSSGEAPLPGHHPAWVSSATTGSEKTTTPEQLRRRRRELQRELREIDLQLQNSRK